MSDSAVEVHPLTPDRWPDLVTLFGERGAADGCWCMWWRQTSEEYRTGRGESNRQAMEQVVRENRVPGLLAYVDGAPAGWCAVAPRDEYPRVQRSRTVKPVDDQPAWAVVCFYTDRKFRQQGVGRVLLRAAVEHAVAHGARIVEGYPVDPAGTRVTPDAGFHGFVSTFRAAGFEEVLRRNETRPIMRYIAER
ncbi:MAG: GNAT family N-acetyltransferase [Dehalococcoidia bacterium]|nr:GNAT family N-acetyltransferase [Dehalococcoidia bacterium]